MYIGDVTSKAFGASLAGQKLSSGPFFVYLRGPSQSQWTSKSRRIVYVGGRSRAMDEVIQITDYGLEIMGLQLISLFFVS